MSKPFMKGAAFGALIAGVATLFLAPQSGKKTHKDVKKLIDTFSKQFLVQSKNLKKMSRGAYEDMVMASVKDFSKSSKIGKEYLNDVAIALKDRWEDFKNGLELEEMIDTKTPITKSAKSSKKAKKTK
ncbi:MAG: YtxH domain-containing protein [bacterium]|nr:YtxH domain-containing protein [bacterium]